MVGIVNMIRELLFSRREDATVQEARELAHRISAHADAIKNGAEKYIRSRDPFAALMADMYNRDQVNRIYRGNERNN